MIRALHVHSEFHPQASGVARHIDGLARALSSRCGVAVEILAPRASLIPDRPPYRVTIGGIRELAGAIRRSDVVHAHGSRKAITILALHLAAALGKPSVFTPHCYYDGGGLAVRLAKRLWDGTLERWAVWRTGAVILLHAGWRADIMIGRGIRPRYSLVVPNCIDADALDVRLSSIVPVPLEGQPALLSVGRLDPIKRLDDVIAALGQPELATAVLHVVGAGPDAERLRRLAAMPAVAGRVRFYGWQDDGAVAAMMRGCGAMVLASEREGLPTVLLEALLAGIAMVHSDIQGCMAIASEVGWDGAFPQGDVPALARRLDELSGTTVPPSVSDKVRERFTWQGRAAEICALYECLIGG
ncbi:MAG: glycosyltransferase family 4 protein [Rhodospirillaceae bacterium]